MKKILLIIIAVISIGLIGTGLYFTFFGNGNSGLGFGSNKGEIVDVEKELIENEEIHTENVHIYRTIDDAISYLKGNYETEDVKATYNDGIIARIKVLAGTENEVVYVYHINGGDLVIDN